MVLLPLPSEESLPGTKATFSFIAIEGLVTGPQEAH
jgi:hypothetical protein